MAPIRILVILLAGVLVLGAGAQTVSSTFPGTFVDITTTGGTAVTPAITDDAIRVVTTTLGNSMFPAGSVSISTNGFALSGNFPLSTTGYFTESDIPMPAGPVVNMPAAGAGWGGILLPFWDDLYPNTVTPGAGIYWQQTGGVLYIMWNNINHIADLGADPVTFEIQVFSAPGSGPWIQFLYNDTVFGGAYAIDDNGLSATVGYAGSANPNNGNARFSFHTASLSAGLVLSFWPKFGLIASSPGGAGTLQLDITSGPASGAYFLAATLNAGNYPLGWFLGIDISFFDLYNQINTGWPFYYGLDINGNFTIGPVGLPTGLTFYAVALAFPQGSPYPSLRSAAISYTIP